MHSDEITFEKVASDGIEIAIDTRMLGEFPDTVTIQRAFRGVGESEIGLAALNVESVLRGESCLLLRFLHPWGHLVALEARDGAAVLLDDRTQGDHHWSEGRPEASRLDHPPVPVGTEALVEEIIRSTEQFLETAEEPSDRLRRRLFVAEQAYDYYRTHGSIDDYDRSYSRDHVESLLFDGVRDDDLEAYVRESGVVRDVVTDLLDRDDTDAVGDILLRVDEIAGEAIEVLRERPDERVELALRTVLWGDNEDLAPPAIEVLARIDTEQARESIRLMFGESAHPRVRKTAAEALGGLGDDAAVEPLTDAVENDPNGAVRAAAEAALEAIDDQQDVGSWDA